MCLVQAGLAVLVGGAVVILGVHSVSRASVLHREVAELAYLLQLVARYAEPILPVPEVGAGAGDPRRNGSQSCVPYAVDGVRCAMTRAAD